MKLSIAIPLYNKEKHIERNLKSLIEQDLSPSEYEIIIVDDGSTDSGAQIAQNYAERYENIKFFSQPNSGPSVARNKGLDAATGDYIYFLDADDFLAPNGLKSLLDFAEQNQLEILEFKTKELKDGSIPDTAPQIPEELAVPVMDGISYIAEHDFRNEAWRYIIHKKLLADTGIRFIEGTLYEDAIFTANLFLRAKRISKVDLELHRYLLVENSIVRSKDAAHNLRFIHGMVYAIEQIDDMIQSMDRSHNNYNKAVKKFKSRQQAFVFALIIRTFKYRLLSLKELKQILAKLKNLEAYPIDPKIARIGNGNPVYKLFVPIFNNQSMLFLGTRIRSKSPHVNPVDLTI